MTQKGDKLSEDAKDKISQALLKKWQEPGHRKLISRRLMGNRNAVGHKHSESSKRAMAVAKIGNRHGAFKHRIEVDKLWYEDVHIWVHKTYGKPYFCEYCGKTDQTTIRGTLAVKNYFHWSNKSRTYQKDRSDWWMLCVRCHKAYDRKLSTTK